MATDNEKLDKFITAVNDEIDNKINTMLKNAENERKNIIQKAEDDAKEAAEKHFNKSFQKNDKQFVREISCAELNMKKTIIQHRDKLVDNIFNEVERQINEFRKTPKYIDVLVKNLLLMHIADNSEIYVSEEDMKYADILKKAVSAHNVTVSVSERTKLGGLSVYNADKGTIIDKTFDLALAEKKKAFANSNVFK